MYPDKNMFQKKTLKEFILFNQILVCSTLWKKYLNTFSKCWNGIENILIQLLYLKVKLAYKRLEICLCNGLHKQREIQRSNSH